METGNPHIATPLQIELLDAFLNSQDGSMRPDVIVTDGTGYSVVAPGCWGLALELNKQPEHILRLFKDTGENEKMVGEEHVPHAVQRSMHLHVNWTQIHKARASFSGEGNIKVDITDTNGKPVTSLFKMRGERVNDGDWQRLRQSLDNMGQFDLTSKDAGEQVANETQKAFFSKLFGESMQSVVLFTGDHQRATQITSPRVWARWRVVNELDSDGRPLNIIRTTNPGAHLQNNDRRFQGGMPLHQFLHSTHAHVRWTDLTAVAVDVGGPNGNEAIITLNTAKGEPGLKLYATKGMVEPELARIRELVARYSRASI